VLHRRHEICWWSGPNRRVSLVREKETHIATFRPAPRKVQAKLRRETIDSSLKDRPEWGSGDWNVRADLVESPPDARQKCGHILHRRACHPANTTFAQGRLLLKSRAVVREVCPASLKLANDMGADIGGNHRRSLDQILSRERIDARCPNKSAWSLLGHVRLRFPFRSGAFSQRVLSSEPEIRPAETWLANPVLWCAGSFDLSRLLWWANSWTGILPHSALLSRDSHRR